LTIQERDPDRRIAFSPDGRLLAASSEEATTVWDATTGEVRLSFSHPRTHIDDLIFRADGKTLSLLTFYGTIYAYTVDTTDLMDLARSRIKARGLALTTEECQEYQHT